MYAILKKYISVLLYVAVMFSTLFVYQPAYGAVQNIGGFLDFVTQQGQVVGWVANSQDYNQTVTVHIYFDGEAGKGGTYIGNVSANQSRPDLASIGVVGSHGYTFTVPDAYKNGEARSVYVYAINPDSSGNNVLLAGSGKSQAWQLGLNGYLDGVSNGTIVYGWAVNMAAQNQTLTVHIYLDGEAGKGGLYIGQSDANLERPDLNTALSITGNHGFQFTIPATYLDGSVHKIHAYAINPDSVKPPLYLTRSGLSATLNCTNIDCSQIPIAANNGTLSVSPVGLAQTVFKYRTNRCGDLDIPDLPARAFRDAQGNINLISSHYVNYRSKGSTLDSVTRDCAQIMQSGNNPDFNAYQYHEWLATPYTLDGNTVYGLVHNEWYANLVDSRCQPPPAGWVNSITQVISTNSGGSFSHPVKYLVRIPPVVWKVGGPAFSCNNSLTAYGAFEPSNIIKKDGYYYNFFHSEKDPTNITDWGTCVMRTQDISNAESWMVWTGDAWKSSLSTPSCGVLDRANIEKMHESITYNSYLGAYIMVGTRFNPTRFSYSTSQDLIHWTPAVDILTSNVPQGVLSYPSLLDSTDTSRNFENTGQEPYLYFTLSHGGLDRDLVRQKIKLIKLSYVNPIPLTDPIPSPAPTPILITPSPSPTPSPTPPSEELPVSVFPAPVSVSVLPYPSNSLVNDQGIIYLIMGSAKIPFTSMSVFSGLGYKIRYVQKGDTSRYVLPTNGYTLNSSTMAHPWGSWVLNGQTVYYVTEAGFVAVPSWDIFLSNGGKSTFIVKANRADLNMLSTNLNLPVLGQNDFRIIK